MFEEIGVLASDECDARCECMLKQYIQTVEAEALCMKDMIRKEIIACLGNAGLDEAKVSSFKSDLESCAKKLEEQVKIIMHTAEETSDGGDGTYQAAVQARILRLEIMKNIRATVDNIEQHVPEKVWPFASYKQLMFIDQLTE